MAAACTEKLDGGASCPSLCPSQIASFRDTTFEAVVIDTSISGFPTLGLAENLLLANRKDTVETRSIIRFDVLPSNFKPNNGTDTASITAIDSVKLLVVVDSLAVKGASPVTLEAFDGRDWVAAWRAGGPPEAVRIRIRFADGETAGTIVAIPTARRRVS